MLTFYDAFHGIGGMRYGLEQAGMKCVGGCEIDKFACKAYEVINGERCKPTDIRHVDAGGLPDFDCLVFGWPCQDNSIAGKRAGQREGTRSGLLLEAARILRVKKPSYFIAENVEGLFSVNDGFDFYQTIRLFTDLGYDCQWQLLNTRWFLPQNRERIFLVGHLRGKCRPEIFPIEGQDGGIIEKSISVVGKLEGNHEQNSRIYGIDGIAPTLGTMQGGGQIPKILVVGNVNPSRNGMNGQVYDADGISPTLTTNKGEGIKVMVKKAILRQTRTEYGKKMRKEYEGGSLDEGRQSMVTLEPRTDGIANTLTTVQKDNLLLDGNDIRNLTPLECFRLQGYPDWWFYKCREAGISDSQLYKMAGNGVSSPVANEVGIRLMKSIAM